jgi:hypothetical protein
MKRLYLLILYIVFFNADLAGQDKSYGTSLETKISLNIKDETVEYILAEITRIYNIEFSYSGSIVDVYRNVSVNVHEEPLIQLLQLIFETYPVSFSVVKNRIVFKRKKEPLLQTVKGKVIDIGSKAAVVGATVFIENTSPVLGAVTDEEGVFKVKNVPIGRQSISVSHISYESFHLPCFMVLSGKEKIFLI